MSNQPLTPNNIALIPRGLEASSTDFQKIVKRYKETRLAALQSDPEAFSSTYERESQFTDEVWVSRLQNPLGKTFIALDKDILSCQSDEGETRSTGESGSEATPLARLLDGVNWVGQLVLLGPVPLPDDDREMMERAPWSVFQNINFVEAAGRPIVGGSHLAYMLAGMFVLPEGRRRGNGKRLVEASLRAVRAARRVRGARKATVVIMVNPDNRAALQLYERVGFMVREMEATAKGLLEEPVCTMTLEVD